MDFIKANSGKMEAQLKEWGAKIDEMVSKVDAAGVEAKKQTLQQIAELKAKHQATQTKLDALKSATDDKWDTIKIGVERAWNDLETAFKKLTK
jgi:uncharacterized coiled-coil DUF342 family protein